jgi:hypothetical protein
VKGFGFTPVPHISARRLRSETVLEQLVSGLFAEGLSQHVFVVGGDPHVPHGPFADALTIIRSGVMKTYGVEDVGISGYPQGHPAIPDSVLWAALEETIAELACESAGVTELLRVRENGPSVSAAWVSALGCQLCPAGALGEGTMWAAGRSLPGMRLAFALTAAINGSTDSSATLSHGL